MTQVRGKEAINKLTGVTPLMFSPEIRAKMSLPKKVVMNDITLREGRQVEGTLMSRDECVKVAELLVNDLNVPMIQMGGYAPRDYETMKAVRRFLDGCGRKVRTESMTSAHQNYPDHDLPQLLRTVDVIGDNGFGVVVCLATSDDLLRGIAKYRHEEHLPIESLRQKELDTGLAAIAFAKTKGIEEININLQDFLRADPGFLRQFVKGVADAGADTVYFDDFGGGIALPILYTEIIRSMKKLVPNTDLGVHVHNTVGLSTATALASVEGGAEVITVGVNGYGEGPGHANLAEVAYNCEFLYGLETGIRFEKMRNISQLIADILRQDLPKNTPIVGERAFVYIHDKHHMFPEYPFIFEPVRASVVGNRCHAGFAEWAGPYTLKSRAGDLGITIPEDKVHPMLEAIEENLKWRRRALSDDEFRELATSICA